MNIERDKEYMSGDQLYRVICIDAPAGEGKLPVIGINVDTGAICRFTSDGHIYAGRTQSLDLEPIPPYDDFRIDDPVMVRDGDRQLWRKRYFAGVDADGRATTWFYGSTSWSVTEGVNTWTQCRRPTPDERITPATARAGGIR